MGAQIVGMRVTLLGILVSAMMLGLLMITSPASCMTFDDWTLSPEATVSGVLNQFAAGPTVAHIGNSVSVSFDSEVFGPGTPSPQGACVTLCSNFFYTVPFNITVRSPEVAVQAGTDYHITFDVNANDLNSDASIVEFPEETFRYRGSGPIEYTILAMNTGNTYLSSVSVDVVPVFSGTITFDINLQTGREVNGGSSSSANPFTETGFYQYSDFSIIPNPPSIIPNPPSAVPLPSTLPLFGAGIAGITAFGAWHRRTGGKAANSGRKVGMVHYGACSPS
jgi:hypothetical protein